MQQKCYSYENKEKTGLFYALNCYKYTTDGSLRRKPVINSA